VFSITSGITIPNLKQQVAVLELIPFSAISNLRGALAAPNNGAAQYQAYQGMRIVQTFAHFFGGLGKDFTCGSSPMNNIKNYAEEGTGKGAILGAFETEEVPGATNLEGAIYGGWVGMVVGTATGAVASGVCGAFGAYGN
jgi:hypothetical protein